MFILKWYHTWYRRPYSVCTSFSHSFFNWWLYMLTTDPEISLESIVFNEADFEINQLFCLIFSPKKNHNFCVCPIFLCWLWGKRIGTNLWSWQFLPSDWMDLLLVSYMTDTGNVFLFGCLASWLSLTPFSSSSTTFFFLELYGSYDDTIWYITINNRISVFIVCIGAIYELKCHYQKNKKWQKFSIVGLIYFVYYSLKYLLYLHWTRLNKQIVRALRQPDPLAACLCGWDWPKYAGLIELELSRLTS